MNKNTDRNFLKRVYDGIISLGDFIEKFKIIRTVGAISLSSIGAHDYYSCNKRSLAEKKEHVHQHTCDSLMHKNDSLKTALLQTKIELEEAR